MISDSDTIVAIATPAGRGGVSIIRLSGPEALEIGNALTGGVPEARRASLRRFLAEDGQAIDFGIVLWFPGPGSFTGEDTIELHAHGGPVIASALLERCVELGARRAAPGEFSKRAFLNDKLDLAQAEAIADIIDSGSRQAARAALRSLEGVFSAAVRTLTELLTQLRMYVEAAIDFPEEEIDFLSDAALTGRIAGVDAEFVALKKRVSQGRLLTDGYQVVLIGEPNAGKSSLMNRLAGADAAIVTAIPGTTRDLVRVSIDLEGLPVELIDTAGLRDAPNEIEEEGISRARAALAAADHSLIIIDATTLDGNIRDETPWQRLETELPENTGRTRVVNKIDLTGLTAGIAGQPEEPVTLGVSALTGAGLDELRAAIRLAAGHEDQGEGSFSARQRHLDALDEAYRHFLAGRNALVTQKAGELMAEELRLAQRSLGSITGEVSSDDLLGRIFGEFCIGK